MKNAFNSLHSNLLKNKMLIQKDTLVFLKSLLLERGWLERVILKRAILKTMLQKVGLLKKAGRNYLKVLSRNCLKVLPRNCFKIFFGMLALFCLSEAKDLIQDKSKVSKEVIASKEVRESKTIASKDFNASNTSNTRKESKESKPYLAISSQKENSKTILNSSKPDSKNLIQENAKASKESKTIKDIKESKEVRESKEAKGFKDIKESKASKDFNASNTRKESKESKSSKNGFFIGLEGDIGDIGVEYNLIDPNTNQTLESEGMGGNGKSSHTTFDYGLIGGYQHYFGKSKRNGIKVASHFYYATFGNTLDTSLSPFEFFNLVLYFNTTESYVSFKLGLDVSYLYDFFERGKHILGLSVGAGYQMNAYIKGKGEGKVEFIDETGETSSGSAQGETSTKNMILNRFYPFIGLHYYYGAHQFEVMYKFGGIPYINQMIPRNLDRFSTPVLQTTFSANSYLSFSYSYRF